MTSKETRWLLVGILVGVIIASAAALVLRVQRSQSSATETVTGAGSETVPTTRAMTPVATPSAVQLSPEEQSKIGLQTTAVRAESVTEDILAIGRVEEPETALATVSTRFGGRIEQLFVKYVGQAVK